MKPQFKFNQPETEYRQAKPELSQTILKNILNHSPAHALESMQNHTDSAAMKIGRAAHCLVLEGEQVFNDQYAAAPECDRRTKEGKAVYAEFIASLNDREALTVIELELITALALVLKTNGLTKHLFIDGQPEVSAFGQINGVDIKGRFDYYHPEEQIIIDLKTCLDASPEAVKKYIVKYGLHIQQYVYSELHRNITGNKPADFIFVMVEKSAPFGVAAFRLKPEAVVLAKDEVEKALDIYQQCKASGIWPAYPETVQEIDLPPWYYSQKEQAA